MSMREGSTGRTNLTSGSRKPCQGKQLGKNEGYTGGRGCSRGRECVKAGQ